LRNCPPSAELFLIGAITFLLTYMILLIRDMDDPFDYDRNGKRGAVEVSLAPLEYLHSALARDLGLLDDSSSSGSVR
jgi:hypothetical protein